MAEFYSNFRFILVPILCWFGIQLFKFLWDLFTLHEVNFKRFIGSGGMPSSHSAIVTSIATMIGKNSGINSPIFALGVIMSLIVMYDAAGVRRAAGEQAKVLNEIVKEKKKTLNQTPEEKLQEALGHTPVQVFAGAFIGILVGLIA